VQLRAELAALHRSLGATMLYVTHDQAEALTMGDRIVVLHQGRIQQIGSPAEVYGAPATTFVARFVGTPGMNLLEGGIVNGDVGPRAFLPLGFSSPLEIPLALAGNPVLAGLRPEHLALTDPDRGAANATVEVIERLGSETLLHLSLSTGARVTVRVPGLDPHHPGDLVGLLPESSLVHWFEAGGRRLVTERRA
jgi:ABC-type sugar transport system ATPase subunit